MTRIVWLFVVAIVAMVLAVCGGNNGSSSGGGGSTAGSVTVSGIDTPNPAVFSTVTITGSGFDPANSAISVLVTPTAGGVPIAVPARAATSTTISFAVPPLIDRTTGLPISGPVTLQVLQLAGSNLATSTALSGVSIQALPTVASGAPTGALTLAFIKGGQSVLDTVQATTTTRLASVRTAAATLSTRLADLATSITPLNNGSTTFVSLGTTTGVSFTFRGRDLALSDRMILAYLTQFSNGMQGTTTSHALVERSSRLTTCTPNTGDAATDALICQFTQYHQQLATQGAAAVQMGAQIEMGAYLGVLGGWAAEGLAAAGALTAEAAESAQVVWGAASSYVTSYATASSPPAMSDSLLHVGADLLDRLALGGVGVLPASLDAMNAYDEAAKLAGGDSSTPQKGIVVSDKATTSGSPTVLALLGSAATDLWLSIPGLAGVTPTSSISLSLSGSGTDGGTTDGGTDAGTQDGGTDGGTTDGGTTDGGTDAGTHDGGTDGGTTDGGTTDGGTTDGGTTDGGTTDGGSNACCACSFDVYCTVYGYGGCWRCTNSTYVNGICQGSSTSLKSPGVCACDPGLWQVCQ